MPHTLATGLALCLSLLSLVYIPPILAEETPQFCLETAPSGPLLPVLPQVIPEKGETHVRADEAEIERDGLSTFSGHVELYKDNQHISADRLTYQQSEDLMDAAGNVIYNTDTGDKFETDILSMKLDEHSGHSGKVSFNLAGAGRGDAERVTFEDANHLRFSRVRYTTCPPERSDWFLSIKELSLDKEQDLGIARHAVVKFYKIPLFYWPYVDFPLSGQRKSGFLAPEVGNSDKRGAELGVPYYWNIAPNYDDTMTPHFYSRRGWQLENEFRYLGSRFSGQLDAEFLPKDEETGDENRGSARYQHNQVLGHRWSSQIDLNWVSDNTYFDDFGDDLDTTSRTHLRREAALNYHGQSWRFTGRALGYQTLTDDPPPYAMLPQLRLATVAPEKINRLNIQFDSEWVNFQRDDDKLIGSPLLDENVTGERLSLHPSLSVPWRSAYGFVIPSTGVHYWSYNLSSTPSYRLQANGLEERFDKAVGYFTLDMGLFFERDYIRQSRSYTQTLEPRLFYVYTPYRDQDQLPDFDTSLPDLSLPRLFQQNRFIGGDRVGDANQLTAALTTRILDGEDGIERLRASIGEIFYFDDRRVLLPASTIPESYTKSDLVAELAALLRGKWFIQSRVLWDHEQENVNQGQMLLQHRPGKNSIFNAAYRLTDPDTNQEQEFADISFQWPFNRRWTLLGRWNYGRKYDATVGRILKRNIQSYVGLGFQSCCWATRLFAKRRLSASGEQVNSVMLQLELKGLAQAGDAPESPLNQSIFADF